MNDALRRFFGIKNKVQVVVCSRCDQIIGTQPGQNPNPEFFYMLCRRCQDLENGLAPRSNQDLGIF